MRPLTALPFLSRTRALSDTVLRLHAIRATNCFEIP